jgi:PRTRC genetic system protein C
MRTADEMVGDEGTAVNATAGAMAAVRRLFRYGGQTFPDPGPEYSVEHVLRHLQGFLPELAQAKVEEKQLPDGTLEITFSKQVARKGAARKGAARQGTAEGHADAG